MLCTYTSSCLLPWSHPKHWQVVLRTPRFHRSGSWLYGFILRPPLLLPPSVSPHKEYKGKSYEELRVEDYILKRTTSLAVGVLVPALCVPVRQKQQGTGEPQWQATAYTIKFSTGFSTMMSISAMKVSIRRLIENIVGEDATFAPVFDADVLLSGEFALVCWCCAVGARMKALLVVLAFTLKQSLRLCLRHRLGVSARHLPLACSRSFSNTLPRSVCRRRYAFSWHAMVCHTMM